MKLEVGKKYKIVAFHSYSIHHKTSPHLVGAVVTCVKFFNVEYPPTPDTVAFDFITDDQVLYFTCAAYVEEVKEMEKESIVISGICIDEKFKFMTVEKSGSQYLHIDFPCYDGFWYNVGITELISGININTKLRGEDALFRIIRHEDKVEFLQICKRPDLKVDDILIVSDCQDFEYEEWRYFSHWAEDGRVVCFHGGKTSLTNNEFETIPIPWKYFRIPTEAEIKERRESI